MKQPDSDSYLDRIRSWARTKTYGNSSTSTDTSRPTLPISNQDANPASARSVLHNDTISPLPSTDLHGHPREPTRSSSNQITDNTSSENPPAAPPPQVDGEGAVINEEKKNVALRFWHTAKTIILSSYVNILLVFVPVGIAAKAAKLSPGIIFGINAIAIIPLAGLLSHATESVAKRMGDTVGALMNITFGNAVELIIL
jgi:Ca2+:H+ antiporter